MTAAQFLAVLERDKLVSPEVLASLRRQIAAAHEPIPPVTLAKLLVKKGKLHWLKAQQLLPQEDFKPAPNAEADQRAAESAIIVKASTESLEAAFGIAHDVEDLSQSESPSLLDFAGELTKPHPPAASSQQPAKKSPTKSPAKTDAAGRTATLDLDDSLVALDGGSSVLGGLEDLLNDQGLSATSGLGSALTSGQSSLGLTPASVGPLVGTHAQATGRGVPRWVWIAAGTLGVLVVGGALTAGYVMRGNGDEPLQAAEADFQQKSYGPAIEKYTDFLAAYPRHRLSGAAQVRRAIARIRQASEPRPDWPALLPVVQSQLDEVCTLGEYQEYCNEITQLLSSLAGGLCERAEKSASSDPSAFVATAHEALALLKDNRIVPPANRPWQQIESFEDRLALVSYRAQQLPATEKAITTIRKSIAAKQPAAAYAALDELATTYPMAADSAALTSLAEQIAQVELHLAKTNHDRLASSPEEAITPVLGSLTPGVVSGQPIAKLRGQKCFVAHRGAVYCLDAETGRLLWRRHVGLDAAWIEAGGKPSARLVLFAPGERQLTCVAAASGNLVWRIELPGPLSGSPLVIGKQLLAASRTGQVVSLAIETGESAAQLKLPLGVDGGMAASADGAWLYVLAERGLLFSISTADLAAQAAMHVNVEPLRTLPPVVVGRNLVLIDNRGDSDAVLLPIALDKRGAASIALTPLGLTSAVTATPVQIGAKLLLPTLGGEVLACELTTNAQTPLKAAVSISPAADNSTAASSQTRLLSPGLLAAGADLYAAARGLTKLPLTSAGKGSPAWTSLADSLCQPPQVFGEHLIVSHVITGSAGFCVSALAASSGAPVWQAQVGAPILHIAASAAETELTMVTAAGNIINSTLDNSARVVNTKAEAIEPRPAFQFATALGKSDWLLSASGSATLEYVADDAKRQLSTLPGPLACRPQTFGTGVLAPLTSGEVLLIDPRTVNGQSGEPLAAPFIPRLQAGMHMQWRFIAVNSDNEPDAVLCDGVRNCYRISIASDPAPRLRVDARLENELAQGARGVEINTGSKRSLLLVNGTGTVWTCDRQTLAVDQQWPLSATATVWGPYVAGDIVLLATDRDELYAFTDRGQLWKASLTDGPPAGQPLVTPGGLLVLSARGSVLRLDAKTGATTATVDVGQSLAAGPFAIADGFAVGTSDGTVLKIQAP